MAWGSPESGLFELACASGVEDAVGVFGDGAAGVAVAGGDDGVDCAMTLPLDSSPINKAAKVGFIYAPSST